MSQTEFSWLNKQGRKTFAREWAPQNPPRGVVGLVHGLGEHIGRYQYVADRLNQAGYALFGIDLPGHGRSEGARGHFSFVEGMEEIDLLLQEARKRYPGSPLFLYGHSMGGALTLYYVLNRKPDLRGVVVTSPGLATGAPVPSSKIRLAKIMARLFPSFTMENGLDLNNLSRDPDVIQAYKDDPLVHPRISARLGLDLLTLGEWMLAQAPSFKPPLLLVQGAKDHIVSPKATAAFAAAVPADKITYKVWDGFYHETHNEPEKEQVVAYMIDWLNQRA
jgi:alpha-beta hydrolase superfamily lysophospholipase